VLTSAVESSRPWIAGAGHQLTVALPPEPLFGEGDPTRLGQVFGNLLTNAARYTDRGGRIRRAAERQGSAVRVTVPDNGIGIAPEHLPGLFPRFSQVAPARERSQGGLGIGLSLVKSLVKMHRGQVEARRDGPGRGSAFVVWLPLLRKDEGGRMKDESGEGGGSLHPSSLILPGGGSWSPTTAGTRP
jgi:signal transduction histidine kinase